MFERHRRTEPQLSLKDKALRLLSIALGNIDTVQEEVDKINSYGQARRTKEVKRTFKAMDEEDFVDLLKKGGVTSIEAIVQLNRLSPITKRGVIGYFSHNLKFVGTLENKRRVEYRVYHGREVDNKDADSSPIEDGEALKTYLTAGRALNNLKLTFPHVETRLSTLNRKTNLTKDYYRQMVESGRRYKVRPRS